MKSIKPNENGEVTLYGNTVTIKSGAKTVRLFGTEYKVDWGKKSTKSKTEEKSEGQPDKSDK